MHKHSLTQLFVLISAFALAALPAAAQTSGTVTISAAVSTALKLTSGGTATLTGNVGGAAMDAGSDTDIATTVDFGEVGPSNASSFVCFAQSILIRSTEDTFSFKAQLTTDNFAAAAGAGLGPDDVGIGVTALGESGNGVHVDATRAARVAGFDSDPCAASQDADGVPTFSKSLNDVMAATSLVRDTTAGNTPVTTGASFNSPNNAVTASVKLAIAPLAYTPATHAGSVLTFTLVTP